jgi:hypothetical protein
VIHVPGKVEQDATGFHHTTQNNTQFKTHELFISDIFHLIFLTAVNHNWYHGKQNWMGGPVILFFIFSSLILSPPLWIIWFTVVHIWIDFIALISLLCSFKIYQMKNTHSQLNFRRFIVRAFSCWSALNMCNYRIKKTKSFGRSCKTQSFYTWMILNYNL